MTAFAKQACLRLITSLLLVLITAGSVGAADNSAAEIEYLLQAVGTSGCVFERNGKRHDSAEAESHLRLKYSNGKRYIDSAETFIERLATKSSWTGKAYTIECSGQPVPSADWLMLELSAYRESAVAAE